MQGGDDPPDRVVEQGRAHAGLLRELKVVRRAEERLVLLDWFPLVVKNGSAASDPTRIDGSRSRVIHVLRARLGLDLSLNLASEAVGVREVVLNLRCRP